MSSPLVSLGSVSGDLWVFGYGSLVWRPAFAFAERRVGWIANYTRRFWQASTDHRGTPAHPGRVVTLIQHQGGSCGGVAYRVASQDALGVLAQLDHRERAGYRRESVTIRLVSGEEIEGLTYIAPPGNAHYLGPATISEIAQVVRGARGPSGPNDEYVIQLSRGLSELGIVDDHVTALADELDT